MLSKWFLFWAFGFYVALMICSCSPEWCLDKHPKNCEGCPVSLLIVMSQRLSWIQFVKCQNCNRCLKCHKSLGLSLLLSLSFCWFHHVPRHPDQIPQRSQVKDLRCQKVSIKISKFSKKCQNSKLKNVKYLNIFLWEKLACMVLSSSDVSCQAASGHLKDTKCVKRVVCFKELRIKDCQSKWCGKSPGWAV